MSETYIVTAKTVDEAIEIAKREYEDAEHEVSYDIIDMPKKGFLGIGARDAKIKITVSRIEKVELGSLVDEIRSMKTITDRGNNGTRQNHHEQGQNVKPHAKQNSSSQPAQPKQNAQPAQPKQKTQPAQPKQNAQPVQPKQKTQPAQPKQNAQPAQPKQNTKPETKPETKVEPKVQPKTEAKPQPKKEAKPETKPETKVEAKVNEVKPETKAEAKPQTKPEPKVEAKVENKVEPKAEPKAETKAESAPETQAYKSHLGNEVKQKNRRNEIKPKNADVIPSSQVTVAEPMGLSDFSGEKKEGFGSSDGESSYRRMSNDIRKKPRAAQTAVTDPAKANRDALRALTINVDEHLTSETDENTASAAETVSAPEEKVNANVNVNVNVKKSSSQRRRDNRRNENRMPTASEETEVTEGNADEQTNTPAVPEEKRVKEGVTQAEMDYALDFANTLLKNMKLDATAVQADANGEEYVMNGDANVYPKINITGSDTGILIGHHGETLDAIQYLANLTALRKSKQGDGDYVKIVVDIEGYREKREETLRALARRMAAKAVKFKRNVFLEPMNAYERRIIHSELQSYDKVSTHSVGTDKDRKIIITYEGADKREYVKKKPEGDGASANASVNAVKEKRRPKKPTRLPIDKLTDLLESREDAAETVVSEATEAVETAEAVSETSEE